MGSFTVTAASPPDRTREQEAAMARLTFIDWILSDARLLPDLPSLLDAFAGKLLAAGVPLVRMTLGLRLLHPQIRFKNYYWRRDEEAVEIVQRGHDTEKSPEYLASPIAAILDQGAEALRFRIETIVPPWPYPIVGELHEQGATDYVIMAVTFANGRRNMASFATDRPGGFSTADLALIDGVMPAFVTVVEAITLRFLATTVLDTYVGRRTGARILSGEIRRGSGADVRAVLWYCDLRGFTRLADKLPREELIALLNNYFEVMGGAVEAQGGEILKFIGDAMLALFPVAEDDGNGEQAAAFRALTAAETALSAMQTLNGERAAWGQPILRCGISLHVGDVMYGNIGAPDRLDFTIIGPAVNLLSRIEGLCSRLDRPVLTSAAFAALCPGRLASLGWHPVKGLSEPVEVYGLVE